LFATFKQMSLSLSSSFEPSNGTGGAALNDTLGVSYSVIYKSATTYKVNVTVSSSLSPYPVAFTAWVLTNGTEAAVYVSGQNYTRDSLYADAMVPISNDIAFPDEVNGGALSPYLHETTKGTATFGTTEIDVVNYAANSLPLSVSGCGETDTITAYSLQLGSIPSGSQQVLTSLSSVVTMQGPGPLGSGIETMTYQVVSLTPA